VEKQIAILYCGTKGLLQRVPIKSIKNFQIEFLHFLEEKHADTLDALKKGKLDDEITQVLESVCSDIAAKYVA